MKKAFTQYLASIGISTPIMSRIDKVYESYRMICPQPITGIFVTDYITADGTREYQNLWFFSKHFVMEAKDFLASDVFDFDPLHKRPYHLGIQKQDYEFGKATEKSRMTVEFSLLPGEWHGQLRAAKENCDQIGRAHV